MDRINVIIPTFRPKEYLIECLRSLDRQTLDKELYKITIVLNGEKEPYESFIKEKIGKFNFHWNLYYSSKNGVSNARNIGLNNTQEDYITFIDDDDFVSNNFLKGLYDKRSKDCIVISKCVEFLEKNQSQKESFLSTSIENVKGDSRISYIHRSIFSTCWGKLIPLKTIGKKRFNPKVSIGEDCCFMIKLMKDVDIFRKANEDSIYFIRNRFGSISRSSHSFSILFTNKWNQLIDYASSIGWYSIDKWLIYINRLLSVFFIWK